MIEQNSDTQSDREAIKNTFIKYRSEIECLISMAVIALLLYCFLPSPVAKTNDQQEAVTTSEAQGINKFYSYASNLIWTPEQTPNIQLAVTQSYATVLYQNTFHIEMYLYNNTDLYLDGVKFDIQTYACEQQNNVKSCTQIQVIKDATEIIMRGYPRKAIKTTTYVKIPQIKEGIEYTHRIFLKNVATMKYVPSEHMINSANVDTTVICGGGEIHESRPTMLGSSEQLNQPQHVGC